MKWIGQHIYDLVARFRNDVYLEDLSTTTETNVLVVDSTGKVSKTTVITGDVTGVTAGSNITVTDPTGPVPTVALSTNVDVAGTLDVTSLGTFDASVTVAGKISLKDAGDSIFVGYEAGLNDDASANLNVGVGYQALRTNTTGAGNTAHGYRALYSNTTGANNVAVGREALLYNTVGSQTAVGYQALRTNTTGASNTAHGYQALYSNTTGTSNSAHGIQALYSNTTGSYNSATGVNALQSNTTGANNTATGVNALYLNTTGANNSGFGVQALSFNTTGANNTANGYQAMYSNTTGASNTAHGLRALYFNTTGSNSVAVGRDAGRFIADGTTANTITSNSVFLGYNTKALADSQTNQIVIGDSAVGLGSNTAILGNSSITKTQLQGNVGIGTTSPGAPLHIVATTQLTDALILEFSGTYVGGPYQTFQYNEGAFAPSETTDLWGGLRFRSAYSSGTYSGYGAAIEARQDGTLTSTSSPAALIFKTTDDGTLVLDERMRITNAGKVGIGTTAPVNKLEIQNTTSVAGGISKGEYPLQLTNTGIGNTGVTGIAFSAQSDDTDIKSAIVFKGSTNGYNRGDIQFLMNSANDQTNVAVDTSAVLTIKDSGNVGIGTASPSSLLHISSGTSGDATLIIEADTDNNNENDNPKLQFKQDGGLVSASAGITGDAGAVFTNSLMNATYLGSESDIPLQLFTNSSAKLTILSNGNVGIGTTSPSSLLHIAGVNGEAFRWSNSSTVYGKLSCGTAGARIDVTGANSGYGLSFSMDDSAKMVILPSGNVGIGAATPLNKLDIVGSLGRGAPVTKTTDFTVAATENWLIMNGTATITITLPTASSWTGRELMIKNIAAYTVISASSNVKPIDTDNAATAILPATAGSWCTLVSDGTNWVTMMN
jgi:hypothetical protein